jgi:hypothetical protein
MSDDTIYFLLLMMLVAVFATGVLFGMWDD